MSSIDFLGSEIDIMGQCLCQETERNCQFLGTDTDIMGERYYNPPAPQGVIQFLNSHLHQCTIYLLRSFLYKVSHCEFYNTYLTSYFFDCIFLPVLFQFII